jgi:hypothetical protein
VLNVFTFSFRPPPFAVSIPFHVAQIRPKPKSLMTKNEFVSKQLDWKRYQRRQKKIVILWGAGFSIFFLWSYLAAGKIDMHWTSPLFATFFMVYLVGGFFAMLWHGVRRMKQLGMFCARCKWGQYYLFNAIVTRRILTTGKCRCGQQIIESHGIVSNRHA